MLLAVCSCQDPRRWTKPDSLGKSRISRNTLGGLHWDGSQGGVAFCLKGEKQTCPLHREQGWPGRFRVRHPIPVWPFVYSLPVFPFLLVDLWLGTETREGMDPIFLSTHPCYSPMAGFSFQLGKGQAVGQRVGKSEKNKWLCAWMKTALPVLSSGMSSSLWNIERIF